MTGYQSKKTAALDEDGMYLVHHTAQPAQELVKYKCTVIDDQHPQGIPLEQWGNTGKAQRPWVDLTPQDLNEIFAVAMTGEGAVHLALEKIKEKNT